MSNKDDTKNKPRKYNKKSYDKNKKKHDEYGEKKYDDIDYEKDKPPHW